MNALLLAAALAPAFHLAEVRGGWIDSTALRGRVVVLAFFASWCAPCREEVPALRRLQREGAAVVGVSFDESDAIAARFAAARALTYPVGRPDPAFDAAYGRLLRLSGDRLFSADGLVNATLPTAIVIDKAGRLLGVYVGSARFAAARRAVASLMR